MNVPSGWDPNERRRLTLGVGFQTVATALLRDREPERGDLVLLQIAVVDAALAGDSEVLNCVPNVVGRLKRYAPRDAAWSERLRGLLDGLESIAVLGEALLTAEERRDD